MTELEVMSIATLDRGALIERMEEGLKSLMADLGDPNADPEAPRKMTTSLTLKPAKDGRTVAVQYKVTLTTAPPPAGADTRIVIIK